MIKRKNIELALLFGLIFSVFLSFADFDSRCTDIKNGVLRLHIIANSDSNADQTLKLAVRDAILSGTKGDFDGCDDINSAVKAAKINTDKINKIAELTVRDNGYGYSCSTSVKKEFFTTRVYDDFTLPAGEYDSLTVRIGNAKGHNWWCVIFPSVCIPAAEGNSRLEKSVETESASMCYNSEKYILRFKTAEIYEKIKENIKNF